LPQWGVPVNSPCLEFVAGHSGGSLDLCLWVDWYALSVCSCSTPPLTFSFGGRAPSSEVPGTALCFPLVNPSDLSPQQCLFSAARLIGSFAALAHVWALVLLYVFCPFFRKATVPRFPFRAVHVFVPGVLDRFGSVFRRFFCHSPHLLVGPVSAGPSPLSRGA